MKNRAFVLFVCIAFLAVMAGMVYAKGNTGAAVTEPDEICEPMSQGFWKRLCDGVTGERQKKNHPATTLFDFENTYDEELCADLQAKTKGDPCARAYAQYSALLYNLQFGILSEECMVFEDDGTETTVYSMLLDIENLLGAGDPESCKEAAYLAEGINSRNFFEDPYYVANLFNVEQNTFYKDIYAKVSNWLNDFLKI